MESDKLLRVMSLSGSVALWVMYRPSFEKQSTGLILRSITLLNAAGPELSAFCYSTYSSSFFKPGAYITHNAT